MDESNGMDNPFPLYVQLDDGKLIRIETMERILYHLEAIDIENDEYLFWDASGNGIKVVLTAKVGRFRNPTVSGLRPVENPISFQMAVQEWAKHIQVDVDANGTPQQIWERLCAAQARRSGAR